ncbi:hypothetical protein I552_10126, partial [Mycobacterium xenopi 3993]
EFRDRVAAFRSGWAKTAGRCRARRTQGRPEVDGGRLANVSGQRFAGMLVAGSISVNSSPKGGLGTH